MERTIKKTPLSVQMRRRSKKVVEEKPEYDGDDSQIISTGSTLLDLEISGGRIRGGGVPSGILVEVFGPSSSGKTVLLCEMAGAIQRQKGQIMFNDPESRLNKQFAEIFDFKVDAEDYHTPDVVPEVFNAIHAWKVPDDRVHGIFTDSLAALSTNMEMGSDEGDKMGMRRAKEFSEGFRKTCRLITKSNYLMVCSNQVRQAVGATKFEPKYHTPGGEATGFYASLRLQTRHPQKIRKEISIQGKKVKKVKGVTVTVEVFKSSVWKPYGQAPVTILFDYGIDDIRQNLQYIKNFTSATQYSLNGEKLPAIMEDAITIIEEEGLEKELKVEVIDLWESIDKKFKSDRKKKVRQ